ncbi:MAG: hypothetical protein M1441_01730 [Candidatus Parvarchaeota archaeon]|jgi:hypothetical protein|nr:hypothetical protein [Candidatus Parvarchaeota archaeon]
MISIPLILGIAIIIVAIITFIRIIKQVLEGAVIIILIVIGSFLIYHSVPIIGVPNFHIPISLGPNILGANPGVGNTTDIAVFNANALAIGSFSVTLNNKSVAVLNPSLSIPATKTGVLVLNSTAHGKIVLKAGTDVLGFTLATLSASYNYT